LVTEDARGVYIVRQYFISGLRISLFSYTFEPEVIMKKKHSSLLLLGTLSLLVVFQTCSCSAENWLTNVVMTNSSGQSVHMWTTGESINLENKLDPGESRTKLLETDVDYITTDITLTVSVGMGDQVLTSSSFIVGEGECTLNVEYTNGSLVEVE